MHILNLYITEFHKKFFKKQTKQINHDCDLNVRWSFSSNDEQQSSLCPPVYNIPVARLRTVTDDNIRSGPFMVFHRYKVQVGLF